MTYREKEILNVIKENPLISQMEIAKLLGITRSSVAVHITNLMKKGYIIGKGYIIPNTKDYVCVIGGANMDIQGFPGETLNIHDSNPGDVKLSFGGVGRNIAENLTKLDSHVKLLTAIGKDIHGDNILKHSHSIGLDMTNALILNNYQTSTYLSILDGKGDMHVAISDMAIMEEVSVGYITNKKDIVENCKVCVLDTNLPSETLQFLLTNFKDTAFFVDTVSTYKAKKIKDFIGYFHTIKPNIYEVEMLTGVKIVDTYDLEKAATILLNKGVKKVFITMGKEGVFYSDGTESNLLPSPQVNVINATGAGDAFTAGLVHSYMSNFTMEEAAKFSMAASILTLSHEDTINPHFNEKNIYQIMEEL
ncbi:PfkB family carbohydrate kinase [Vallitalea okinawensis]|uniref:PfkB family carbohydrate kinase n=1 Tax=Vallitalea okinawensis TaxID=2078660 RepID=UPI000CFA867F|nr:PfkB family carbohydrate kinase [Vallitalea okinawensis]